MSVRRLNQLMHVFCFSKKGEIDAKVQSEQDEERGKRTRGNSGLLSKYYFLGSTSILECTG